MPSRMVGLLLARKIVDQVGRLEASVGWSMSFISVEKHDTTQKKYHHELGTHTNDRPLSVLCNEPNNGIPVQPNSLPIPTVSEPTTNPLLQRPSIKRSIDGRTKPTSYDYTPARPPSPLFFTPRSRTSTGGTEASVSMVPYMMRQLELELAARGGRDDVAMEDGMVRPGVVALELGLPEEPADVEME